MVSPLRNNDPDVVCFPSRPRVSPRRKARSTGKITQELVRLDELIVRRKDLLAVSENAYCRRTGESKAQFAAALSRVSGHPVTAKLVQHWLDRSDLGREMPRHMESAWVALTEASIGFERPLPEDRLRLSAERRKAQRELDAAEFDAYLETA